MSKTTRAQSDNSSTVTVGDVVIAGQSYAPDAAVTVMGKTFTVVGSGRFAASRNSGLSAGDYPVVFEMIGDRKAYRVYANGEFYPIREFGTPNAIISKQRETRATRSAPKSAAPAEDEGEDLELSVEAGRLLTEYVSLNRGVSQSKVLSELVVKHLGPEVERLRRTQEAIKKLPMDLLARLAESSDEKRAEILALLR